MNLSIFKNIPFKKRTACAVCRKTLDKPLIEFPALPLTDILVQEKVTERMGFADQGLALCPQCGHAQLSNIIDTKVLYGPAYSYRTSKSIWVQGAKKGNDSFVSFIDKVTEGRIFKTIIEIGCNDLYLLNSLKPRAEKLVGVDPVLKGREEELSDGKITAIGDFLENIDLGRYMDSESTLILSNHSLEHLENPRATIERLLAVSTDKTLFIFEFPGFDSLINDCRFDQVFHHHLHYFSLHSFVYLLNELGCELISHEVDPHYWGSLLVAFRKTSKKEINQLQSAEKFGSERILKNYDLFKQKMDITNRYIESFRKEKLFGYGAGLQLPVLGYHLNNDFSYFNCIIDDDKDKEGLFYLNLPVSIKNSTGLDNLEEAIVVITAVNFSRNILPKVIGFKPKRIILPFSNI